MHPGDHDVVGETPDKTGWNDGDRTVDCWLNNN
jgi:hypothetical protein